MFKNKKQALNCALQAGAARRYAQFKSGRQFKHAASEKKPYKPGSLGLSAVSTAIKKEYGSILPRGARTKRFTAGGSEC